MSRMHEVEYGNTKRMSFSKIHESLDIPYFIALQRESYDNFIKEGLKSVLQDFSPIVDDAGRLELEFLDYRFEGEPKYSIKECKDRDCTYAIPLKVTVRLRNRETGEIQDSEVFMSEFPLMTDNGSFIINGAERVIVSQIVRSPGVYCKENTDKNGVHRFDTDVIPVRGAWLEFRQDATDKLWVHVDRNRKLLASTLMRALGYASDEELLSLFGDNKIWIETVLKDTSKSVEDAKVELFRRLKSGEVPTIDSVTNLINSTFYERRKYDTQRVGRYKFNKKLAISTRIAGFEVAEDIVSPDGEVLAKAGDVLTNEQALNIQNSGVNKVVMKKPYNKTEKSVIVGNNTVDLDAFVDCNPKELGILERVNYTVLNKLMTEFTGDELIAAIKQNVDNLVPHHITLDDIIATVSYNLSLNDGFGETDNIDHLANRRVKAVGELLQNQMRQGLAHLEKNVKERMRSNDSAEAVTAQHYINIKPVNSKIKEFFCSSQLSQFMDHHNPIAELTHKRKLSALGPGGLNRERAGFDVRDVHHSHYGRMCPIETPEGQNIGLISSLATYARVNEYGFIEAPYRRVDKETGVVTDEVEYLQADEEDKYIVAQANEELDENSRFVRERVTCRIKEDIREVERSVVDYMDVSPKQLVSVAAALIPFLENDDTSRALMGSNMQRQAVPLIKTEAPVIGTGIEYRIAHDSGVCVIAKNEGIVSYVDSVCIKVTTPEGNTDTYALRKYERSNQGTCINQRPVVKLGQKVKQDEIIADGPSTSNGELALGKNILIGFMSWEGYNYEDAILISEDLVKEDVFTSIHIEEYEIDARQTKLGDEQITRDIPNASEDLLKNLDVDGIIRIGAEVHSEDYLVGKVTPKGEADLSPEDRLLRAIFGEKVRDVRDTSLKLPHGQYGVVVDVKVFTKENKDELQPGVDKLVRVYVAQKRKLGVGDKMAGRHGNKGVVSRVLPREDMPYLPNGTPLQIVLNPLGVPSRMNIGQVLEVHLGLVAKLMGFKIATPVFDGASEDDIQKLFRENGLPDNGKLRLFDGRTGDEFENPVTVGFMYMLKLIHLVDDKIHARATGPYSLVTQQPLGGKAQFGGQRFGEMEVWALEAYGASHVLQELLTVKSDDVEGRVKMFNSIVKGDATICEPGIPESFKVLVQEFRSLGLDIKALNERDEEVMIDNIVDTDTDDYSDDDLNEIELDMSTFDDSVDIFGLDNDSDDDIFGGKSGGEEFDLFDNDEDIFGSIDLLGSDSDDEE